MNPEEPDISREPATTVGSLVLFAAYFFDFVFQHFNDIYVQISGNKVEKQTIAHSVLIIIKSYRSIGYS